MRHQNRLLEIFMQHMLPLVCVVLLLGLGATISTHYFIRSSSKAQMQRTLHDAVSFYDNVFDEMDSLMLSFGENTELLDRLNEIQMQVNKDELELDSYQELKLIHSFLAAPANSRPYITSTMVYADNPAGLVHTNSGAVFLPYMHDTSWYEWYVRDTAGQAMLPMMTGPSKGTEKPVVRILRRFKNQARHASGVIVLDIDAAWLENAFLAEPSSLTVQDRYGRVMFGGGNVTDGISFTIMGKHGLSYTIMQSKESLYALSRLVGWMTTVLTLVAIALGLLLTFMVNRQERAFLATVIQQFRSVGDEVSVEDVPVSQNIFEYLNYHVIKSFLEKDYLAWQREALEYRALQMQINPHFLFNTLDTINWKAIHLTGGENDVSRMILLLAKLLKYSLSGNIRDGVPLREELKETDNYLEIQRYRFRDRFSYHADVDPALLDISVPALILQPMLENSFNHGFTDSRQLAIRLSVSRQEDKVEIVVSNDGLPMDEKTLEKLNGDDTKAVMHTTSIGVMNIRKRMSLFTGGQSTMRVESDGKRGVSIIITMPFGQRCRNVRLAEEENQGF